MKSPRLYWQLALLITIAGCGSDDGPAEVETPPILLRWTVPASGTEGHHDEAGRTLIAHFNREVMPGEVTTNLLIPAPVSSGSVSYDTPQQIEWNDVVFDPDVTTYTWLIDGPDFAGPVLVEIHPRTRNTPLELGTISGRIEVGRSRANADDTLVFVIGRLADPEPEGQLTYFGRRVHRIARVDAFAVAGANTFSISGLDTLRTRRFAVLAIDDFDGDGRYDLDADWWGYERNSLRPEEPIFVVPYVVVDRSVRCRLRLELPLSRNIEILPPGQLEPDWSYANRPYRSPSDACAEAVW